MGRPPKEASEVKGSVKYKVVTLGEYQIKARELFGVDNINNNALALLYSENEVIDQVNLKGDLRFIIKV